MPAPYYPPQQPAPVMMPVAYPVPQQPQVIITGGGGCTHTGYAVNPWGVPIPSHLPKIHANPSCHKCHGTGYKYKKGNWKPCKNCMHHVKNIFTCSKCANTGYKIKNGKRCKCPSGISKMFFWYTDCFSTMNELQIVTPIFFWRWRFWLILFGI